MRRVAHQKVIKDYLFDNAANTDFERATPELSFEHFRDRSSCSYSVCKALAEVNRDRDEGENNILGVVYAWCEDGFQSLVTIDLRGAKENSPPFSKIRVKFEKRVTLLSKCLLD